MELRHLRYFVTVAEELHFRRAAERLQMTQPALSKQIAGLEQELNVQLLVRTKRTVQLTAAGQVLFDQAKQVLFQVDETIQRVKRTANGEEGTLTIGFTTTATATVLPSLVRRFRDRWPKVEHVICRSLADCPIKLQFAAAWRQDAMAPTLREFLATLLQGEQISNPVPD